MEELIKRLERVIATGAPDKDGMHPISAETVLEVVKELSELSTNSAEVSTDCISRQAAIDALARMAREKFNLSDEFNHYLAGLMDGENAIRHLPSAQPERIKSKWALHTYMPHNKFCLACHNNSPYNKRWNFCPNCGADMREVTT